MYTSHTILYFNLICIFKFALKRTLTSFKFFSVSSRLIFLIWYNSFLSKSGSIFSCAPFSELTFWFSCKSISSTALLKIVLLSYCLLNFFLFVVSLPWSLVDVLLAYLDNNSPSTLHSSDKFLGPCIIHVSLYLPFVWSTYPFLCFPEISLISEWVFDESYSPLFILLLQSLLSSDPVVFYKKVLIHLRK